MSKVDGTYNRTIGINQHGTALNGRGKVQPLAELITEGQKVWKNFQKSGRQLVIASHPVVPKKRPVVNTIFVDVGALGIIDFTTFDADMPFNQGIETQKLTKSGWGIPANRSVHSWKVTYKYTANTTKACIGSINYISPFFGPQSAGNLAFSGGSGEHNEELNLISPIVPAIYAASVSLSMQSPLNAGETVVIEGVKVVFTLTPL